MSARICSTACLIYGHKRPRLRALRPEERAAVTFPGIRGKRRALPTIAFASDPLVGPRSLGFQRIERFVLRFGTCL